MAEARDASETVGLLGGKEGGEAAEAHSSIFRQFVDFVDSRVSLKTVYRRLQLIARFLIVGTFIDDALRVACDYRGQVQTMRGLGWGAGLPAAMMPVAFVLIQATGAGLVLTGRGPQTGCITLLIWASIHPFIYAQQRNLEFLLESVTIIGGLIILLSSERRMHAARKRLNAPRAARATMGDVAAEQEEGARVLLLGRICLSAVFVFYVVKMIIERLKGLTSGNYDEDPLVAVVAGVLLVLLMLITGLIVIGIKARWCAIVLAAVMAVCALYKHPWFITMWTGKEYKLDFIVGFEGVRVDAWLYSDHQRYFFFQQLSTVGALLQLVAHGPGKYSMDESEASSDTMLQVVTLTSKGQE